MTESTRKKMVFGLLGAAIIFGATNIEWSTENPTAPLPQSQTTPAAASQDDPAVITDPGGGSDANPGQTNHAALWINIDSVLQTPWGADPFQFRRQNVPSQKKTSKAVRWKVSGIVYSSSNPMAVVNSRPVAVGDVIDNATVIKIEKNRVTLECRGDRITIGVNEG
jgi:hypothetical protein